MSTTPDTQVRRPGPAPAGRTCRKNTCATVLSTWNPTEYCGACGGWVQYSTRAAERSMADLLTELMET